MYWRIFCFYCKSHVRLSMLREIIDHLFCVMNQ